MYPTDQLQLPPTLRIPRGLRDAFSRYLAEITYMDSQVGELLATLESEGKTSETIVTFLLLEQGSQFPGNKWTNWDTGLHTGLVIRWPGINTDWGYYRCDCSLCRSCSHPV